MVKFCFLKKLNELKFLKKKNVFKKFLTDGKLFFLELKYKFIVNTVVKKINIVNKKKKRIKNKKI